MPVYLYYNMIKYSLINLSVKIVIYFNVEYI